MKKILSLSLFLFLFPVFCPSFCQLCFSENGVTLSAEEWQTLKTNLQKLKEINADNLNQLESLRIMNAEQAQLLQSANQSLKQLKKETERKQIKIGAICICAGIATGFIAGAIAN